ncbi:DJ-1/PfpI family protein [Streptomyces sp. NPDC051310]|uniref:DJ-1/PfpI family protein n=1 Tax=Streptomyces sp. NPDC051310 TaxID=3365649 RepID=UPI00378D090B
MAPGDVLVSGHGRQAARADRRLRRCADSRHRVPQWRVDIANRYGAEPPYSIELRTLGRRVACSSAGIELGAGQGLETVAGHLDTLFVVGGSGCEDAAADERLLGQVRRLAGLTRRVASVCTGAYVLAAAGLLDHRRVTAHWGWGNDLPSVIPPWPWTSLLCIHVTATSTPRPGSPALST